MLNKVHVDSMKEIGVNVFKNAHGRGKNVLNAKWEGFRAYY